MARQRLDPNTVAGKMARATSLLICNHPFFSAILLRLIRIEGYQDNGYVASGPCPCPENVTWPNCPHSMATDGKHLLYNPRFVAPLTVPEVLGVLAHECMHVAGLHPWRRMRREPYPWNYACDQAVNALLERVPFTLPKGIVPGVPDKSAEELYALLPPQSQLMAGGGSGTPIGDVFEPRNPDGSPLTEQQRAKAEGAARIMVQQALNAAKQAGRLPAGFERMMQDVLEPRVPWKEILARFIDGRHRTDYSWSRPNRRYVSDGVMFPSLWSPGYGLIVLGCDTSGSIDQAQLRDICSEMFACLAAYEERGQTIQLPVYWFDSAVYPQIIEDADELRPQGGGGTSYRPVFDKLREDGHQARALIMVTDGHCSDYGTAPDCPVLWVLTRPNSAFQPPFGEITCTINN